MTKEKNNGLQKFTHLELLKKDEITKKDLDSLSKSEQKEFDEFCDDKMLTSKGIERDKFIKQIWNLISENTKKSIWEHNHQKIINALHNGIITDFHFSSVTEISIKTGLSRTTVHKHLNEYKTSELYNEQKENFKVLRNDMIKAVYRLGINGNVQACKLFLEVIGEVNIQKPSQYIDKQQNNFNTNQIIEDVKNLTLDERLKKLNLTHQEIYDYLEKISKELDSEL